MRARIASVSRVLQCYCSAATPKKSTDITVTVTNPIT